MKSPTRPLVRRLRRHQFLRVEQPRQLCLRAEHGTLWVTTDGELDDIVLDLGASRVFNGTAPILVSALDGDAVLSAMPLTAPRVAPRSAAEPWLRWMAALRQHAQGLALG